MDRRLAARNLAARTLAAAAWLAGWPFLVSRTVLASSHPDRLRARVVVAVTLTAGLLYYVSIARLALPRSSPDAGPGQSATVGRSATPTTEPRLTHPPPDASTIPAPTTGSSSTASPTTAKTVPTRPGPSLVAPATTSPRVPPAGLHRQVCGTWALQAVGGPADLEAARASIERALRTPEVRGLSLRVPWTAFADDLALLDAGRDMAAGAGVAYSVRFMAGRHTPGSVYAAGSPSYVIPGGRVPTPFTPDGSPNTVFERAYDREVARLAAYARANGIRLLHLPWYGQDYAELNNGAEVRAQPGYSYENWLVAHERLIDIAASHAGPDLAVEFPLSGYGPLVAAAGDLADAVLDRSRASGKTIFVQANGWGPNGDWGARDPTVEAQMDAAVWPKAVDRGEQAIQPDDYDWPAMYRSLRQNRATYAEVYVPSFGKARSAELAAELRRFAEECA